MPPALFNRFAPTVSDPARAPHRANISTRISGRASRSASSCFARHAARPLAVALVALSAWVAGAPAACAQPEGPGTGAPPGRLPTVNVSTELPPSVLHGLAKAHVPLSSVSVVVERIGDRQPSVAVNAAQPMMPASTMKLVTTYTGLSLLGPDYRWRTSAYADGDLDANGVLHGDLYVQGTGDPKLVPEELIDLVQKIRASGIARIDGALVLDKSAFDPSTRDLPPFDDDVDAPYNVGPDPLMYAFKSVTFTLTPAGGSVAIDVVPPLAQLQIDNRMRVQNSGCAGILFTPRFGPGQPGTAQIIANFEGPYGRRCGARSLNMAAPVNHTTFFANGFLALWAQAGGTFSGTVREGAVPPRARLVGVHESPPLGDIVHDINKFSNNVMARNLFLTIGETQNKGPATTAGAANAVEGYLRRSGIDMPGLVMDNGCGLSRDEHVSALALTNLLQAANASPVAQVFADSLPVPGVDGTMRHRLRNQPVEGNAHIKTGTLRDVRSIAGYVSAANGSTYVVVSLINDPHAEAARAAHDALLEWVYQGMPEEAPVYVDPHPKKALKQRIARKFERTAEAKTAERKAKRKKLAE